jgi:hypothetical protein
MVPSELIGTLQRCVCLRRLWYELSPGELSRQTADALMGVQCAVPRMRWHLDGSCRDVFDTTRKYCTGDYCGRGIV